MMNILARILSHGFAIAIVAIIALGYIYRGELFQEYDVLGMLGIETDVQTEKDTGAAIDAGVDESPEPLNGQPADTSEIVTLEGGAPALDVAEPDVEEPVSAEPPAVQTGTTGRTEEGETGESGRAEPDVAATPAPPVEDAVTAPAGLSTTPSMATTAEDAIETDEAEEPAGTGPDVTPAPAPPVGDAVTAPAGLSTTPSMATMAEDAIETDEAEEPAGTGPDVTPAPAPPVGDAVTAPAGLSSTPSTARVGTGTSDVGADISPDIGAAVKGYEAESAQAQDGQAFSESSGPVGEIPAPATSNGDTSTLEPAAHELEDSDKETAVEEPAAPTGGMPGASLQEATGQRDAYLKLEEAREAYWLRDYQKAESSYRELIAMEPGNPDGYGELGNMYFSQGAWEDAGSAYYEAGKRLLEQGQIPQARQLVQVIRGLDGTQADELDSLVNAASAETP